MATSIATIDDELKCAICLEWFVDPRNLPCLHSFCLECLQRSLDDKITWFKCPMCRSKHVLDKDCLQLLPVDQYALQQLPLRKLQQQKEIVSDEKKCGFCGEAETPVAWCSDCGVLICDSCLALHEKMAYLKDHKIMQKDQGASCSTKRAATGCLRHSGQELEYFCTHCFESVCSTCLLMGPHKDHQYSTAAEARHYLETKMRGLMDTVATKKEEFNEYLEKVGKIEGEALERSDFMTKEVNNIFDGIAASVEAQRNEALQSVSHGVKEIWAQKELTEINLSQLNSFIRFAAHTHECATDSSFVAMATQGIKLMNQLESVRGDRHVLDHKKVVFGSRSIEVFPLGDMFKLGQPVLQLSPQSRTNFTSACVGKHSINIRVSLMVGDLPVSSRALNEKCNLYAFARLTSKGDNIANEEDPIVEVKIVESSDEISWNVSIPVYCSKYLKEVTVRCRVSGAVSTDRNKAYYTFSSSPRLE